MDAGGSVRRMMEYLRQKKIPLQCDVEGLERDKERFQRRMAK